MEEVRYKVKARNEDIGRERNAIEDSECEE